MKCIVPISTICDKPVAPGEAYLACDGENGDDKPCIIATGPTAKQRIVLYAGAQTLLEACKRTVRVLQKHAPEYWSTDIDRLSRAIAKAEGTS
jgi:hypothetical protein